MARRRQRRSVSDYVAGIRAGDRVMLSQAITVIESRLPEDRALATDILEAILPDTGNSIRIGITGVPGVGKSTFIESFGGFITGMDKPLAVLAIDPSSQRSRGSIMGDKTRMDTLARDPKAYIRPSPAGTSLGGVSTRTRESMLLCEAAGFEVIIIETVGVGQSETAVQGMVDFFLLLMLAGAGDELQGIKRGIMEMADVIAITKADGDNTKAANKARVEYANAVHLFPPAPSNWAPEVKTCSALLKDGLEDIWESIERYQQQTRASGYFVQRRKEQNRQWMQDTVAQYLEEFFYQRKVVQSALDTIGTAISSGEMTGLGAARKLIDRFEASLGVDS